MGNGSPAASEVDGLRVAGIRVPCNPDPGIVGEDTLDAGFISGEPSATVTWPACRE